MNAPMRAPVRIEGRPRGSGAVIGRLALLVVLLTAASVAVGYAPFDVPAAAGDVLTRRATLPALVLWELRLPCALLGGLVGFSLGLTGATMQGYLRNPLADPGILGISSAAALGAVLVFYGGFAASLSLTLPLGWIVGAALAALVLNLFAARGSSTLGLILAGVALSSSAGAIRYRELFGADHGRSSSCSVNRRLFRAPAFSRHVLSNGILENKARWRRDRPQ